MKNHEELIIALKIWTAGQPTRETCDHLGQFLPLQKEVQNITDKYRYQLELATASDALQYRKKKCNSSDWRDVKPGQEN